jgi:transposase
LATADLKRLIAKNVFQVHGIDAAEKVVVRKQLRRGQILGFFEALPRCLVGLEACATSHYWARKLTKLGHQVRLMPAKDVKAYVKRNKNDAADAEAICEAVRRPTICYQRRSGNRLGTNECTVLVVVVARHACCTAPHRSSVNACYAYWR